MEWHFASALLLWGLNLSAGQPLHDAYNVYSPNVIAEDAPDDDQNVFHMKTEEEANIDQISSLLTKLLMLPWPNDQSPLIYVENSPSETEIVQNDKNLASTPLKRSRLYRKYPWKRQNPARYHAETMYLCQPTKDDVSRLLVAMHDTRGGNRGKNIQFCNRRRTAKSIYTHIRYVGK